MSNTYSFGITELDEVLGEIPAGFIVVIEGFAGSGKTTFALEIAYKNAVEGRGKVLYVSFNETAEKLISFARGIGLNFEELVKKGVVKFVRVPELIGKDIVEYVASLILENINEYRIIVLDTITVLMKALGGFVEKRSLIHTSIYDAVSEAKGLLILIADVLQTDDMDLRLLEYVADVVIELSYRISQVGFMERTIIVKKFRGREIRTPSIPFTILSGRGITILNYISEKTVMECRKRAEAINIECEPLQKLLPKEIKPGTSIVLINRSNIPFIDINLKHYIVRKLIDVSKKGSNVLFLTYDHKHEDIAKNYVKRLGIDKNFLVIHIPPSGVDISSMVGVVLDSINKYKPMAALICGVHRIWHAYRDYEPMYRYFMYIIEALRSAGITTFYYLELQEDEDVPRVYLDWCDVVLELVKEKDRVVLKTVKSSVARRYGFVYDEDIEKCIDTKIS